MMHFLSVIYKHALLPECKCPPIISRYFQNHRK